MALAALTALVVAGAAAAAAGPLAVPEAAWRKKGFAVRETLERGGKPFPVAAVVYQNPAGGGDRLEVYALLKDKAYTIWMHPGSAERLELEATPAGKDPALLGDGSRAIAYRASIPGVFATLRVLRVRGLTVDLAGEFPDARFLELGGETVIASRERPLGLVMSVACKDFGAASRSAFKTTLHAPRKGRFTEVTARHPDFFAAEIERKRAALESLKTDMQKNGGEYLGLALSVYYDHAARGERRLGWAALGEFFSLPAYAPPSAKACLSEMEKDLRSRLKIPASWK